MIVAAPTAQASLISLHLTGTVTSNSSSISLATGTPWQLTLVYSSSAPDTDPNDFSYGLYTCQTNSQAISSVAFTLESYAINLSNLATLNSPPTIEVYSFNENSKDFDLSLQYPVLGTFHGKAVNRFYFSLTDQSGNYADGTDALPEDLSLDETDLALKFFHVTTATGIIFLDVNTVAFASVPEVPTGTSAGRGRRFAPRREDTRGAATALNIETPEKRTVSS